MGQLLPSAPQLVLYAAVLSRFPIALSLQASPSRFPAAPPNGCPGNNIVLSSDDPNCREVGVSAWMSSVTLPRGLGWWVRLPRSITIHSSAKGLKFKRCEAACDFGFRRPVRLETDLVPTRILPCQHDRVGDDLSSVR